MKEKTVFIGLSGGVDSAVSALLLKEEGYKVVGVHIDTGQGGTGPAKRVSEQLKIDFKEVDFSKKFKAEVIDAFTEAYKEGQTPNPCIICNQKIKFGLFYDYCLEEGADYISTGHYARVVDRKYLAKGKDQLKDQSYFLYQVKEKQLNNILFPVGEMTKQQVVQIAMDKGIEAVKSKESQDVCFISDNDIQRYLRDNIGENKGDIIDIQTKDKVGTHRGIHYYTLGQRSGIHVGGVERPYYVAGKDKDKNILYVAQGNEHKSLWKTKVNIKDESWINEPPKNGKIYEGMIRYRMEPVKCSYESGKIVFSKPVWSPTPGQSVVLYDNDRVVGGGVIEK